MSEATQDEIKWLKSLHRCLKKKPKSVEILVQEQSNNFNGCSSEIHLMKKGVIHESQSGGDQDLIFYSPSEHSIDYITVDGVAANNHGY